MFDVFGGSVKALDGTAVANIQARIDGKTKPPGALGELEHLARQLALITAPDGQAPIKLERPQMWVFAADHGIASAGVSIAPSEVTQQMVMNFANGGAAINCFCRSADMALTVVNAGMLASVNHPAVVEASLGQGTQDISREPAMTLEQCHVGLSKGAALITAQAEQGTNVFGFGEMGIGNTSAAAAVLSALLQRPASETVGRGTGINDEVLVRKTQLIEQALERHAQLPEADSVDVILASLGGFEIIQMVGAMIGAAQTRSVVLVDGFIATAAALAAVRLVPEVREYMVFCHRSEEQAHALALTALQARPLLDLSLRLGEGTGAALALPLLKAAAAFYNDMASFADAGVTEV